VGVNRSTALFAAGARQILVIGAEGHAIGPAGVPGQGVELLTCSGVPNLDGGIVTGWGNEFSIVDESPRGFINYGFVLIFPAMISALICSNSPLTLAGMSESNSWNGAMLISPVSSVPIWMPPVNVPSMMACTA